MSEPVTWPGSNFTLQPPAGSENIQPLPIFRNGTCCVSCWQLTEDEFAEIVATKRVFISVFWGNTQPPVFVGSETSVRELVADYGAWKR